MTFNRVFWREYDKFASLGYFHWFFFYYYVYTVDIKRDIDLFGLPKSRRSGVGMQIEQPVNNNTTNANNNNSSSKVATAADVKTERLSPVAAGGGGDSASSRSGTPSSSCYPGTPPGMAAAADRVASPAPNPLNRNCSDLIRSLAAKYQNANPSEWVRRFMCFFL